jgi:hypothetical protein
MSITVSGEPGKPIVFEPAPHAQVVIKGSEPVRGEWTKVTPDQGVPEPYPNAFQNVWKVKLGDEFFNDPQDPRAFADKANCKVHQVLLNDTEPLFPVGPDSKIGTGDKGAWVVVEPVGKGREDVRTGTYYFDRDTQELYTKVGGQPGWYSLEVSVRDGVIRIKDAHDLVIRGLDVRHSRDNLVGMNGCQRVILENCKLVLAAFCNLGMHRCTDCVVRRCDLSWGGNSGVNMGLSLDCIIEDSSIMFNNYRRYASGWHNGGMKNIPGNKRTTVRRCEVAYNGSDGIWFDMLNVDTRILDNVIHHNRGSGIHVEVNYGPGLIAGNLCYANDYGISVVGHPTLDLIRKVARGEAGDRNEKRFIPAELKDWIDLPDELLWVVNNTLAENGTGIATSHDEGTTEFGQTRQLANVRVMNNLFLRNGQPGGDPLGKYVDLRFWMHAGKDGRTDMNCHSDYNVFAAGTRPMLKPDYHYAWGKERTLEEWRSLYGEDIHSRIAPVTYECSWRGFRMERTRALKCATRLPREVLSLWTPAHPAFVGAGLTQWGGR